MNVAALIEFLHPNIPPICWLICLSKGKHILILHKQLPESFGLTFAATAVPFVKPMPQRKDGKTCGKNGKRERWENLWSHEKMYKSDIGTVFAHSLFTQLICPSDEKERKKRIEKQKKRTRKKVNVALNMKARLS